MSDDATYILDNAWVEARRRLSLVEECWDPLTIRALDGVGVGPGWRCLDVGAGGGSITRWLCSRVGPSGRVAAVDLDTRFLEEIAEDNLEVHRQDVVADGLPGGGYDLVHTRLLLIHLPTRDQLLGALVASLRPGGWLVVEDGDTFPVSALAAGLYADVWSKVMLAFETAGMHHTWARELPGLFDRAGLEAVDAVCDAGLIRGGTAYAELMSLSMVQLRDLILAAGATEAQLDQMATLLADPTQWFPGWGMFCVRGRAPGR